MKTLQTQSVMKGIIIGMCLLFLPMLASAQWFMMDEWFGEKTRVTLKFLHPNLVPQHYLDANFKPDISVINGIYDLSINIPFKSGKSRFNFEASFPFVFNSKNNIYYNIEKNTIAGNLYLGLQWKLPKKKRTAVSIGAYLPTATDNRWYTYWFALHTDWTGFAKYQAGQVILTANYHSYLSLGKFDIGYEVGPATFFETGESGYMDPVLYIHYGLYGMYRAGIVTIRTELAGFEILAGEKTSSVDNFPSNIALGVRFGRGSIRPSLFYMRNLKEERREEVKDVLGFQLQFVFK
ncbi:MAG: hypothetical protein L0Y73_01750 [Candidatus Aminicenantes bacterium]|nr:hypothetical protein [Candidatus Aminicenantes bacterium]